MRKIVPISSRVTSVSTSTMSDDSTKPQADGYFGLCPTCGNHDGYMNNREHHWFVCDEHRVKWYAGSNLFSSWRDETEADWQATRETLAKFEIVEPRREKG